MHIQPFGEIELHRLEQRLGLALLTGRHDLLEGHAGFNAETFLSNDRPFVQLHAHKMSRDAGYLHAVFIVEKIQQEAKNLRNLGYDIHMVFVNTSLDVALERNRNRPRKLPDAIIINSHKQIQKNMGRLQRIFGARNFVVVDNNEVAQDVNPTVHKRVRGMIGRAPTSYQAVKWIHRELEKRKRK